MQRTEWDYHERTGSRKKRAGEDHEEKDDDDDCQFVERPKHPWKGLARGAYWGSLFARGQTTENTDGQKDEEMDGGAINGMKTSEY